MRILLTAFEPFDDTGLNASLEGCRSFLERRGGVFDVRFGVLPVRYGDDVAALDRLLADWPAEIRLHTGQAGGSNRLRVERIAVNVRYASSGPERRAGPERLIDTRGPAAVFSTLPVDPMASAIRQAGLDAEVSNHAGIYLCNHILYHSARRARRESARAGFLHVPWLPEQVGEAEPTLTAEEIGRGIHAALEAATAL